jgi:DNA-binding transcriptional MerR regulator
MRTFSAQQAAERTGLSVFTLRYYERAGLIPRVERAANSHRRYGELDLEWIGFVARMRATGMSIGEIRRYTELVQAGDGTVSDRLALLEEHRARLVERIDELCESLRILDGKIAGYQALHDDLTQNGACEPGSGSVP